MTIDRLYVRPGLCSVVCWVGCDWLSATRMEWTVLEVLGLN